MKKNTFWQQWGMHLAYLSVITALFLFLKKGNSSTVSQEMVAQTMQNQKNIAEHEHKISEALFNELRVKPGRIHPSFDKLIDSLAKATQNDLDEMKMALTNANQMLLEKANAHSNESALKEFWKNHAPILDKLSVRLKTDLPDRVPKSGINFDEMLGLKTADLASGETDAPKTLLETDLKNASVDDLLLFATNLKVNLEIIRRAMFQHFYGLTKNLDQWGYDFQIMMLAPRPVAKIGEPWEAKFYLCPVGVQAQNLYFEVAGQHVLQSSNGVFYQKTFDAAGEQKLPVVVKMQNPQSKDIKEYKAEFIVPVQ